MKKYRVMVLFLLLGLHSVYGQEGYTNTVEKWMITYTPQLVFVNGVKFDLDHRFYKRHWLSISSEIYLGRVNRRGGAASSEARQLPSFYHGPDSISGGGLELSYKYVFTNPYRKERVYVALGSSFRSFRIHYNDEVWKKVEQDGLIVFKKLPEAKKGIIFRYGPSLMIGVQVTETNLAADISIGIGLRNAQVEDDLNRLRNYTRTFFDYASTGYTFLLSYKIGGIF